MLLSSAMTIILFLSVAAGLMKVFQIASDVKELKDGMQEIKRNTQALGYLRPAMPPAPAGPLSPEALVRAVHAQSYESVDANLYPPQS
jgi:hypothetical protein